MWISAKFNLHVIRAFDQRQAPIDPMTALNDPATMRTLLLGYAEKVLALQSEVEVLGPMAAALQRIAGTDGTVTITEAAKHLQLPPHKLTELLSRRKWIYKRPNGKNWIAYQNAIQTGLLCHKVTAVHVDDEGHEKFREQVRVTRKGLARLATLIEQGVTA